MIKEVVVALKLLQVRVVVAPSHAEVSLVGYVFSTILPGIRVERRIAHHIAHAARRGGRLAVALGVARPLVTVRPTGVIRIDEASVHDVQFAGLEQIGGWQVYGLAVECRHRGFQLGDARVARHQVRTGRLWVAAAKGNPSRTLLVDDHARVEHPVAGVHTSHAVTNHRLAVGRLERSYGRAAFDDAHAAATVGKVDEELLLVVSRLAPGRRGCPRLAAPRTAHLAHVDGAVERPVHHVGGRKHHQRFYVAVAVASFSAVMDKLLVVVRAVHIQPSLVVNCRRVGTEYARADGVAVAYLFIVGCYALGIQLKARSPDGCCQKHFLIHG